MDTTTPVPFAAPVSATPVHRTYIPVIDHGLKALALQREQGLRTMAAAAATIQVLPQAMDEDGLDDLWQMQAAVRERLAGLQRAWLDAWFDWARYSGRTEGANTMAKLAEREYNITAQAVQLVGEQCEDLLALFENIQVAYLYWINRKIQTPPA